MKNKYLKTLVNELYKIIAEKYYQSAEYIIRYDVIINDIPLEVIGGKDIAGSKLKIQFFIYEIPNDWGPDDETGPLVVTYIFDKNQQIEYMCSNNKVKYLLNLGKNNPSFYRE